MNKTKKHFMIRFLIAIFILTIQSCSSENKKIAIQPYGDMDAQIIDSIFSILDRTYNYEIHLLDTKPLPISSFIHVKSPRYRADSLLIDLVINRSDSIDYVLGITAKDISTTKRNASGSIKEPEWKYSDWGIFGLGYKPGHGCVISTFRLKNKNRIVFFERIQKVAVHEIGHNLGLDHCETKNCVMQDAVESISTLDNEGFELCDKCLLNIR